MDCPELSMEHSDGSQECVLPLSKRRPEKKQELAFLRSYQDPHQTALIRTMVRPGRNSRLAYQQRANSAEDLSYGERTPNSVLSKNGVVQRRLLRRRSFGGLEPGDDSELPGESTPPQIPRNYKCCDIVMAEIVEKLKGDNHVKDSGQSQRFDPPLDNANSVCRPLVSVSQHDSKPCTGTRPSSSIQRRRSTGHLQGTNTRLQIHSMEGKQFPPGLVTISNHEMSTGLRLPNVPGQHQDGMPKTSEDKKGSFTYEKKPMERRIRREKSCNSYSRTEMMTCEKHKSSSIGLKGQYSFDMHNASFLPARRTDQIPIIRNDDQSPLTVQPGTIDHARTNDRRRRQRSIHRNLSGPLVKTVRMKVNGLATAVPKEELFLLWLKQQNGSDEALRDASVLTASSVNTIEGNDRPTRQGVTTLSDRRAMRQVRRRNSQST